MQYLNIIYNILRIYLKIFNLFKICYGFNYRGKIIDELGIAFRLIK